MYGLFTDRLTILAFMWLAHIAYIYRTQNNIRILFSQKTTVYNFALSRLIALISFDDVVERIRYDVGCSGEQKAYADRRDL